MQKMDWDPSLSARKNLNSKLIKNCDIRHGSLKPIEEKAGNVLTIGTGVDSLKRILVAKK